MVTIAQWNEKNPYMIYGDYNDAISAEMAEMLLDGDFEGFDMAFWEWGINAQDYADRDGHYKNMLEELELDDTEENRESFDESICFDCSDFLYTCLRNANFNVVLTPIHPETKEPFYTVIPSMGFSDMLSNARELNRFFGIRNYRKIESMYEHETLKICGKVDFLELYKTQKIPSKWVISPQDNAIFHTSWNGSGCLGDVNITKTCEIECKVSLDNKDRYGVQEVYGFTSRFWESDLIAA